MWDIHIYIYIYSRRQCPFDAHEATEFERFEENSKIMSSVKCPFCLRLQWSKYNWRTISIWCGRFVLRTQTCKCRRQMLFSHFTWIISSHIIPSKTINKKCYILFNVFSAFTSVFRIPPPLCSSSEKYKNVCSEETKTFWCAHKKNGKRKT